MKWAQGRCRAGILAGGGGRIEDRRSRYLRGDYAQARQRWQRGLDLGRELDNQWLVLALTNNLASMELTVGRFDEARVLLLECAAGLKVMPDPAISLPVLESVARFCADLDPGRAAR